MKITSLSELLPSFCLNGGFASARKALRINEPAPRGGFFVSAS